MTLHENVIPSEAAEDFAACQAQTCFWSAQSMATRKKPARRVANKARSRPARRPWMSG
jgi:hypothetical protein